MALYGECREVEEPAGVGEDDDTDPRKERGATWHIGEEGRRHDS